MTTTELPTAPAPTAPPEAIDLPAGTRSGRRKELAAFLRACRARVSPEAVGLPPGPRRRTPGLRREEVAQLAGVGVTWYTWLEQGRPINASDQVLSAVARTLSLDPAERTHLFRLAGVVAPDEQGHVCVPTMVRGVLDALDPLPASVTSAMFDVLAWNSSYAAMLSGVVARPDGVRKNPLWCAFTVPECCNPMLDRDIQLPLMVDQLRAEYGRHVGDPVWEEFLARLRATSADFVELWNRQRVRSPGTGHRRFQHAAVGELHFDTAMFQPISIPGTRLTVFTPQDDETTTRLAWLREHPEAPASQHDHPDPLS